MAIGPPAIPALREALHAERTADPCAKALGEIGGGDAMAIPIEGLRDPVSRVRDKCALSLGLMKAEAASAVPGLVVLLGNATPTARYSAALALGRIGGGIVGLPDDRRPAGVLDAAISALKGAAEDPDEKVRQAAHAALARIRR